MSTLFHNQCYIDENESTFLAWEAIQGDEPFSVYHEMSFFIEDNNGTYQRFNESHYQRTFEKTYINMLNQIGFKTSKHLLTLTEIITMIMVSACSS